MRDRRRAVKLIISAFIFVSVNAAAQTYDLGEGLTIDQHQLDQIRSTLPHTTEDKTYFHWADDDRALRWIKQGYVDKGEVDYLTKPSGTLQAHGGGIYLSSSPAGTTEYGNTGVAFEIKKGSLQYDPNVVSKVVGKTLTKQQASELGRHIPMIRDLGNGEWSLIASPELASRASSAARFGGHVQDRKGSMHLQRIISELAVQDPKRYGYLESMAHLMNYQDGVSFARSVRANPNNPWSEFDPEHFESYRNTARQYYAEASQGKKFGITDSRGNYGSGGSGSADQWADKQITLLEDLHKGVMGQTNTEMRAGAVIGGGDGSSRINSLSGYIDASRAQLRELEKNPYLRIENAGFEGKYYKIKIHYPVVEDFERLKDFMSPEMYEKIKSRGSFLKGNPHDRAVFNQEFLKDLMKTRLKNAYGQKEDASLYRDLVSIHAYDDKNGRSIRMMQRLAASDSGKMVPYFAISDMDLLTSPSLQNSVLAKSGPAYEKWLADMLAETQAAQREGRQPNLIKYDHEARVAEALSDLRGKPVFDPQSQEQIRKREWAQLLDSWVAPNWQEFRDADLSDMVKNPHNYIGESLSAEDFHKNLERVAAEKLAIVEVRLGRLFEETKDPEIHATLLKATKDIVAGSNADDYIQRDIAKIWKSMADSGALNKMDKDALSVLAARAMGQVDISKNLNDKQMANVVEYAMNHKNSEKYFDSLGVLLGNMKKDGRELGPEFKKSMEALLNKPLNAASRAQVMGSLGLWKTYVDAGGSGSFGAEYLKRNMRYFDKNQMAYVYKSVAAIPTSPETPQLRAAAFAAGVEEYRRNPNGGIGEVKEFFDLVEPRDLNKRELASIISGLRSQAQQPNLASVEVKLAAAPLKDNEIRLLEREITKAHSGRGPMSEAYYTMVRLLHKNKPDSPVLAQAAKLAVQGDRGAHFLARSKIWTADMQADFLAHPDKYKSTHDVIAGIDSLKTAPPDADKVLAQLHGRNSGKETHDLLIRLASKMPPSQTKAFDEMIASRIADVSKQDGFVDYAKNRPFVKEALIKDIDTMKSANYAAVAEVIHDDPAALGKLVDRVNNGSLRVSGYYDTAEDSKQANALWEIVKDNKDVMTKQREYGFAMQSRDPDRIFAVVTKDPKLFQRWFSNLSAKNNDEVLKRVLAMEKPPLFVRGHLLAALTEGQGQEKVVLNAFGSQDNLKPWQRDIVMSFLRNSRSKSKWDMGWNLGYDGLKTGAERELAGLYLSKPGWLNSTDLVRGQVQLWDRLKKLGVTPEDYRKGDLDAAKTIGKSLLEKPMTRDEAVAFSRNGGEGWTLAKESMLDSARLTDEAKEAIKKGGFMNGGGYQGINELNRDTSLALYLSKNRGIITNGKIDSWSKHGTCKGPISRFRSKLWEKISDALPF